MNLPATVLLRLWFPSLVAALTVTGCATTVTARHSPLYRAVSHTSTIEAHARNASVGIRRIRITVTTGEMTDCTELVTVPSVFPCRINATVVTHVCGFAGRPANAACTFSQSLGASALVTYQAVAEPATGRSVTTQEITYSGGRPPEASIARPVWWHTGQALAGKLDVGFFPDADYAGNYSAFTGHLQNILEGVFFNSGAGQDFARIYGLFRDSFNLFAAPDGADAEGCARTFNSLVRPIAAVMDGDTIVHRLDFRDCASLSLGGGGSVHGAAIDADYVFVHESGHFLHGQGDEYCCDGGYGFVGPCGNVFGSEAACQAAATAADLPPSDCVSLAPTRPDVWRNDDGNLEIMATRFDLSDWRDNSSRCVAERFVACGGGACY